jgi:hypothetical protein
MVKVGFLRADSETFLALDPVSGMVLLKLD